jgi:DNA-binding transcriptional ArsR family regulator
MKNMPPEGLYEVAWYFQVLAEPTRLRILNILRD